MSTSTKILLGVFVLLAIVAYFLLPSSKERMASYKPTTPKLAIDSANVVKLEIERPGKALTLENVAGKWRITSPGNYLADASSVTRLIGSVKALKVGSLISSNPDKQHLYQVDTTGTKLTITERSGKSLCLIIGKTGPSYSENYFRLVDANDVYLGEGLATWMLNQEVKDWRDKVIFTAPSDSIKQLTVSYRKKTVVLQRDSTTWRSGKDTVDAGIMSTALSTISNLRATDFVDTLFQPKTQPFSLKVHTGTESSLDFYPLPPDSSQYVVQSSQNPQLCVVGKYTVQELIKLIERPKK